MKQLAVPLLVMLTIALAAAAFVQKHQVQSKTTETVQLREELQKAKSQSQESAEKIAALEENAKILSAESAALREKLHAVSPAVAEAAPAADAPPAPGDEESKGGMGDFFKKMFKDPQMKKAMAAQQTIALRQFYSDFVKSSQLTPEQAEKFYDLLGARQMEMMDKAGDLLKGSKPGGDAAQAVADQTKVFDAQLKELLGDTGASQFHDFEKTLGDRMVLNQFSQQLSTSGTPLSSDQNRALLQVMTEERSKQPAAASQPGGSAGLTMSDEQIQQMFQRQEEVNALVRTRAMSLLTADQMQAFEKFQKQQIEMQKMGMTMARQMFGGKK